MLNFVSWVRLLQYGPIDEAIACITSSNANSRDSFGLGVVSNLCYYGPDQPEVLKHFLQLGATLELTNAGERSTPLHCATYGNQPRLLRALLDLGTPVDIVDRSNFTSLHNAFVINVCACAKVLLDAGAKPSKCFDKTPLWVWDYLVKRDCKRATCCIVLGLQRFCSSNTIGGNGRDVLKMIARCIWATR